IMATHDLIQGQLLSDKIAILNGEISQIGSPDEVFRKPKTKFVADFVGVKNLINGTAKILDNNLTIIDTGNINIYSSTQMSGKVHAGIRPEEIIISTKKVETSARNVLKGKVKELIDTGALVNLKIDVGEIFTVLMTRQSFLDLKINLGKELWIYFKASAVHVF
ncbi:MAG: TOBE domain-containing protein, partial [Euryarchaeota archaeon]|nr:TOBE domain-containing protein [Euryarchaeota archaeon]